MRPIEAQLMKYISLESTLQLKQVIITIYIILCIVSNLYSTLYIHFVFIMYRIYPY